MLRLPLTYLLMAGLVLHAAGALVPAADAVSSPAEVAAKIDGFLASHWSARQVKPAAPASDEAFLRRASLDLAGRVPTPAEVDRFLSEKDSAKRKKLVERLITGPEYPLHFGNVFDEMIQRQYAGSESFVDYLRRSLKANKGWDLVFRELMLGPWESDETKAANRFLDKRARTLDVLAADATNVFFGVDISCAKCHDHPLVSDWSQAHYYGMASFFNRTTGGKGKVGEKNDGVVTFLGSDGEEQTAALMFLSGTVIEEPDSKDQDSKKDQKFSRREQLVNIALEDETFFRRAIVNRVWQYFFGQGLVHPVDQMHSENPPSVPGLLEWLADDFAASGYDLRRLMTAITLSQAYGLSSRYVSEDAELPPPSAFAVANLRPLSPRQLAFSLLLVTGEGNYGASDSTKSRMERYLGVEGLARIEQYLALEQASTKLLAPLDPLGREFQSSATEALFMSNNAAVAELIAAKSSDTSKNLAARLAEISDTERLITTASKTILSRSPTADEKARLTAWFAEQQGDRGEICEQLVWALLASAEFRFNH